MKAEIKKQSLEIAAIAAVKMENGEYKYPQGTQRCYDAEGEPAWNKSELCRLAGLPCYAGGHVERVVEQEYFIEMVELHRMRRLDPMFRQNLDDPLAQWTAIGKMGLDNIYEQLAYAPHSVSLADSMKVVKLVLDAGAAFQEAGVKNDRAQEVLARLTPEQRERLLAERKQRALKQIKDIDSQTLAHRGADRETN